MGCECPHCQLQEAEEERDELRTELAQARASLQVITETCADAIRERDWLRTNYPQWTCADCGHVGAHQITHRSIDGDEYDMECDVCESTDVRESPREAANALGDKLDSAHSELTQARSALMAKDAECAELMRQQDELRRAMAVQDRAAKNLVRFADARVSDATKNQPAARAAIATLDSEREANARLTEELEQARAVIVAWKKQHLHDISHAGAMAEESRARKVTIDLLSDALKEARERVAALESAAAPFLRAMESGRWVHALSFRDFDMLSRAVRGAPTPTEPSPLADEWDEYEQQPTPSAPVCMRSDAPRFCNRHIDCNAADARARGQGKASAEHCNDEHCEDCHGR